jgi:hypothetical protein
MSYTLSLTDNTPLLVLADGKVDVDLTSISLIGKNVSNFGDAQNENFLHMLEHFSNVSQPGGDLLKGQIWYNKSDQVLRPAFYDGIAWRPMAVLLYSNTSTDTLINGSGKDYAANRQGDLWFDSVNRQLHIVTDATNGTVTTLIGPESVNGFGTSRLQSVRMTDTAGTSYPVIHMALNGEVIGMISPSTFTPNTATNVTGFTRVYRGITLKNYNSSTLYTTATTDVQLHGLHEQLDPTFVRRNIDENIQSNWSINNTYSLNFGTTAQSSITWSTATSRLLLTSSGGIRLQSSTTAVTFDGSSFTASANTVNLGSTSTRFNVVYANTIDANTVTANVFNGVAIFDNGARVLTTATIGDFGTEFIKGTTNQITVTPSTGTVTLSLPSIVNANTVNATTVTANVFNGVSVFDNGSRVLTTATIGAFSTEFVKGTANQITVTPTSSTVVISLPDTVKIKKLQGGGTANTGTISGTWTLEAGSTLQATYADLAECYKADANYEPGTVLEFGGEFEVTISEDSTRRVAGVVSTAPAYLMNRQLMGENVISIALTGRVPCKVRGKIRKGDMMVSAGNGYARAEYSPILGSIIGKALEDFDGVDGVIEVVVGRL